MQPNEQAETADQPIGESADVQAAVDQTTAEATSQAGGSKTVGLGVDIVEIARIEQTIAQTPDYIERNFTDDERAYCDSKPNPQTHYALHFAAKEAVLKALGTGLSDGIQVTDVQVGHNRFGKPFVILEGRASELAAEQGVNEVYLSLSYTHSTGVASAVAARKEHAPAVEETVDTRKLLTAQFREMRSILDEIDAKLSDTDDVESSDE